MLGGISAIPLALAIRGRILTRTVSINDGFRLHPFGAVGAPLHRLFTSNTVAVSIETIWIISDHCDRATHEARPITLSPRAVIINSDCKAMARVGRMTIVATSIIRSD